MTESKRKDKMKEGLHIVGMGHYAPEHVVTNDDLSKIVDTNDEWISSRTGIRRRHFITEEKNQDMAIAAAKMAIEDAGIDKTDRRCDRSNDPPGSYDTIGRMYGSERIGASTGYSLFRYQCSLLRIHVWCTDRKRHAVTERQEIWRGYR